MAESAALLVDEVLPNGPIRQLTPEMVRSRAMQVLLPRVISFSFQLCYLFACYSKAMSQALAIVYRTIASHLIRKAGLTHKTAKTGGITLIQSFDSTLILNVHFTYVDKYLTGFNKNAYTLQNFYKIASATYRQNNSGKKFAKHIRPDKCT